MALPVEPADLPRWGDQTPGNVVEPSELKKDVGWVVEKMPFQYLNWLFYTTYAYLVWLRSRVLAGSQEYDVIVSNVANMGTHADLKTALADAGVVAGMKILVVQNQTINTAAVLVDKAVEIVFKPGVGLVFGTSATGMNITATGARVKGGKVTGFTTGILIDAAASRVKIGEIDFQTNTNDITDNNGSSVNWGCSFST